ncbi:MAG TPA: cysteine desulfurase family protein [Thermomicrobiales bacterium]|nr:cysteine desulfurase family protein [Thermomicrobiales bacterium]
MTYGSPSVYLDHAATTPVDPAVVDVMLPWFTARFGNPSSIYQIGQEGRAALDQARATLARALHARPGEIVFTSGATESSNLALKGAAWAARQRDPDSIPHLITTRVEHHAVLHAAEALERQGFAVSYLPADSFGQISPDALSSAIRRETCLISIILGNNEIGTIQDISALSAVAQDHDIPFHTDAVQAAGTLALDVDTLGVDLLSLSAHKFYGPKGVGLLYVRKGTPIVFQQDGGGQESGRRGGTENIPLIVGMAEAMRRAEESRDAYNAHCRNLRDRLWNEIASRIPDCRLNGPPLDNRRLVNNLNISVDGVQGETVLLGLDMAGVAASAGSACTTGNSEPSHVLRAIGLSDREARSSIRLSVGRGNTESDIDDALDALEEVIARARSLAPSLPV